MRNGGREKERIESIGNLEERIDKRKVEGKCKIIVMWNFWSSLVWSFLVLERRREMRGHTKKKK